MCGIAGAIALKSAAGKLPEPLERTVERMAQRLTHRGPDGSGLWKSPTERIALAHRRLAIIDLTDTGRQPMEYAGRLWVTFNGEIYNFRELRPQLQGLGHTFRGESDTEVLLAAIAQWGIDAALNRCFGMFALAVWDARDRVLHLARDRMGEKPLYLSEVSGHLFFGSELRAFRAIPGLDARISGKAANAYLRDGCVPGALSIYEGIYKRPPGQVLTVHAGRDQRLPAGWLLPQGASLMGKMARLGSQVGSADARRKLARILTSRTFSETYLRLTSWWVEPSVLDGEFAPPPREWPAQFTDDLPSMLLADQINYLPDDNLAKVDRASMATSLETRLPLLDHRLVEFSWRLPSDMKLHGRTTKWLLRAILDRYVPRSLIERPKMGFTVPIDNWLRGPLRAWAGEMLDASAFHHMFPVQPAALRRLWNQYLGGQGPSANEIWALVMLSAWAGSVGSSASSAERVEHSLPALQ